MERVGIFGASGFVGNTLRRFIREQGGEAVCFSRRERPGFRVFSGPGDFDGLDAVVNLAGEPILGLWTAERKRRILESRVNGTRRIAEALRGSGVRTLVNASAVGYYGNTGDCLVEETSPCGTGFLAETCREWEAAAFSVSADVRVACLRIGFVIGTGGAMSLIRPVFQMGLGGRLGSGRQWMSCIHVEDVAGMILWLLRSEAIAGPVNAVMPAPVTNAEFTKVLAASVRRPAVFPVPSFVLRAALGGLSCLLLDSARVRPAVAERNGYVYRFPELAGAFQSLANPK